MSSRGLLPVAILAGGLATRLYPLTETVPKALIDVAGEPFIVHQLRLLRANHVEHVVLCVGYLGEMIESALASQTFGLDVEFSYDGPRLLGTGGALKKALPLLGNNFFVLYGDSYLTCNFAQVQQTFFESGRKALMAVFRNDGHWDTSNVEFADGNIVAYDKTKRTPRMHHIDYGLGVFRKSAFDDVPACEQYDLAHLYASLHAQRELAAYEVTDRFYEIGSQAGLSELRDVVKSTSARAGRARARRQARRGWSQDH
ncbi:MAG: NTP transferase domain-containing protein [Chloroflexi bacterium]|nr:NTP transferase domain-containing protein [Chloroflexota bacterium]MBV9543773.1 NTP transferase domain-containing protein [Chloroflexota bacterium]